jgi:hypothetical protein
LHPYTSGDEIPSARVARFDLGKVASENAKDVNAYGCRGILAGPEPYTGQVEESLFIDGFSSPEDDLWRVTDGFWPHA